MDRLLRQGPRSLQHPVFQRIWLTGTAGYLARFTDFTLISWLVVERTDDAAAVGMLIFLRLISFFIFGPFVGLVADRLPRIAILRATQVGLSVSALVLGALLLAGSGPLWQLFLYSFVSGVLFMFEISSRRPYISSVVGPKHITAALALDMISLNVAWFLGANAGGAIVASMPAGGFYIAIGAIYLTNSWLLRDLPVLFRKEMAADREPVLRSLISGIQYSRRNRLILGGLIVVAVNNFSGYTFESMVAVVAKDVYGAGPLMFGLLLSAQALGALAVSAILVRYGRRMRRPALLMTAAALLQHLLSFAFSFTGVALIGFLVLVVLGMISMVFGIMHNTLILTATPDRVRGRVIGLQILAMGMFPIGSLAVGQIADVIGLQDAIRVFSLGGAALLLVLLLFFPELRRRTPPQPAPVAAGPLPARAV